MSDPNYEIEAYCKGGFSENDINANNKLIKQLSNDVMRLQENMRKNPNEYIEKLDQNQEYSSHEYDQSLSIKGHDYENEMNYPFESDNVVNTTTLTINEVNTTLFDDDDDTDFQTQEFPDYFGPIYYKAICSIQGLFRIRQAYDQVYDRKVELGIIKIYTELEYYNAACTLQGFYEIIKAKELKRIRQIEYEQEQKDQLNKYHEDYLFDLMVSRIQKNVRRMLIRKYVLYITIYIFYIYFPVSISIS